MTIEIWISIIGALTALTVSSIGAFLANKNSIVLQIRKLKEEHYVSYIEALHNMATEVGNKELIKNYVFTRDKLFLIASEDVIKKIFIYEEEAVGKANELHDKHLTNLVKEIRKDLKIKDKDFPTIYLKKA